MLRTDTTQLSLKVIMNICAYEWHYICDILEVGVVTYHLVVGASWNVNKMRCSRPNRIIEFNSIRFTHRIWKIYILCSTAVDIPFLFVGGQPLFNLRPYMQIYRKTIVF